MEESSFSVANKTIHTFHFFYKQYYLNVNVTFAQTYDLQSENETHNEIVFAKKKLLKIQIKHLKNNKKCQKQ